MDTPKMFYCCDNTLNTTDAFADLPMMLSGGMVWNINGRFSFTVPQCQELLVDSGGFQVSDQWDLTYPYQPSELFDWAESIGADYVALPDYACEPELHQSSVRKRVCLTVQKHVKAKEAYEDGDYSFTPLPVLQGYEPFHYRQCIQKFREAGLIEDYMAVGTVCKREDLATIGEVLDTIEAELPDVHLHMFGMTLKAWKDTGLWGRFRSGDTAAWNWGGGSITEKKKLLGGYVAQIEKIRGAISSQTTLDGWQSKYERRRVERLNMMAARDQPWLQE